MTTLDQIPTFNLKAVIQETGLKSDTLRAWERRYGLPQPKRTPGGHRLYSQQDIDMLKWLIARQEEGLSISRAVDLWRKLEAEGQDPLSSPAYALPESTPKPTFIPQGETLTELRQAWYAACLAFDEQSAENVLAQAFALYPPETVCFEILLKGLSDIGDGWYSNEVTVQQEHFSSELAMRRLEALVAAAPPPTRPGRVVSGCAPEGAHTFVSLLLTLLLKRRGWEVIYLGARVPTLRLPTTIASVRPHLVILTAQRLYTAATLQQAAQVLQQEDVPLAYGGKIFNLLPALRQRIPGHFLGEQVERASQMVEQLLTSPRPVPKAQAVSETYKQALAHYHERRMLLEANVWRRLEAADIPPAYLSLANEEFAHNVVAALTLGDMNFLAADMSWIKGLLTNYHIPEESLRHYMNAYYQAARVHLAEQGNPIVNWLAQLNGKN
jgi:DNA-binding transcriptional MerR regulator